jgi:DNA invertase Pin-like site-specific DNA recombinase
MPRRKPTTPSPDRSVALGYWTAEDQREPALGFAAAGGLVVVGEALERDVGRPLADRRGFFEAVTAAVEARAGVLLATDAASLGDAVDVATATAACEMFRIRLAFVSSDGADPRLVGQLLRFERMMRSFRIRLGRDRAPLAKGRRGAPLPYGRRRDERGEVVDDERELRIVELAHRLRNDGASLRQIADELSAQGLPPRSAARWSAQTVASLLRAKR